MLCRQADQRFQSRIGDRAPLRAEGFSLGVAMHKHTMLARRRIVDNLDRRGRLCERRFAQ